VADLGTGGDFSYQLPSVNMNERSHENLGTYSQVKGFYQNEYSNPDNNLTMHFPN